jgi:hypothetical protein
MSRSSVIKTPFVVAALASMAIVGTAPAAKAQGLLDVGRFLLGLPTEEKEPIDYRERAPIIVPPNQQSLRPPADARPADQRRGNWPQDPDVIARRQAAEQARKPVMVDSVTGRETPNPRRMTNEEIRAGRVAGAEVPRGNEIAQPPMEQYGPMNVLGGINAIREMDRRDSAAGRNSGNLAREEPRREFLTDPPSGLRRPSDAAAFRATREGDLGARKEPSPLDIFREGPNTR